jgi:hypothetical protein
MLLPKLREHLVSRPSSALRNISQGLADRLHHVRVGGGVEQRWGTFGRGFHSLNPTMMSGEKPSDTISIFIFLASDAISAA